jgi:inner membrane protein
MVAALAAMLPDADVIGFRFGIAYENPYGHRGFTHSLLFAWGVGFLAIWLACPDRKMPSRKWLTGYLCFFAVIVSHGILDAFTNGGLGIAFCWPFSSERFFFPWRPIEVSPFSPSEFFAREGWIVMKNELLWVWAPLAICVAVVSWSRYARGQAEVAGK